jgi:hypothetical protein
MVVAIEDAFDETVSTREATLRRIVNLAEAVFASDHESTEPVAAANTPVIAVGDSGKVLRRINDLEIATLEQVCRCSCANWSNFFLAMEEGMLDRPDISADLHTLVSDTRFDGKIILDLVTECGEDHIPQSPPLTDWLRLPPGIHSNLLISDSIFQVRSCRVYRNSIVSHTFVGSQAALINCGHVTATRTTPSGSQFMYGKLDVTVGPETGGGRNIMVTAESTMMDVAQQLATPPSPTVASASGDNFYLDSTTPPFNVLSSGSFARDTPTIADVYLYRNASIVAASSVRNCTLLPEATIINSSVASNVVMQWNASISDHSKVDTVLMMEEAHCGPSSIVTSTIMGPDTHASAGEIHSSVFGPNTNSHHQSLVIGVLWPLGRGNVGYGANVGSNHTGRIPDQETVAGEGIFWGLSCSIKFPVDLSSAPYSIVAAGVRLPPQRITMPFSLIIENSGGQVGQNEIIPGWVLQSSPYTLVRNDKKFATRRKAGRHAHYTGWKVLRPATIEMCRSAKRMLEAKTLESVRGVGACVLTERARKIGIQTYRDCIHRYILQGLLTWLILVTSDDENGYVNVALQHEFLGANQSNTGSEDVTPASLKLTEDSNQVAVEWPSFPWDRNESSINEWAYQRSLLLEEFPIDSPMELTTWLTNLLDKFVALEHDFARRVVKCKRRDDNRGSEIIPGYADSHVSFDADPVVVDVLERAERTEAIVKAMLTKTQT